MNDFLGKNTQSLARAEVCQVTWPWDRSSSRPGARPWFPLQAQTNGPRAWLLRTARTWEKCLVSIWITRVEGENITAYDFERGGTKWWFLYAEILTIMIRVESRDDVFGDTKGKWRKLEANYGILCNAISSTSIPWFWYKPSSTLTWQMQRWM